MHREKRFDSTVYRLALIYLTVCQAILTTNRLTIPLFDWGRRLAAVDARYALLNAVIYDYRQTVFNAYAEAERSLSNYMQEKKRACRSSTIVVTKAKKALSYTLIYVLILEQQGLIDLTEQLLTQERYFLPKKSASKASWQCLLLTSPSTASLLRP